MLSIVEDKWGHFSSTASRNPEVWHVSVSIKTLHSEGVSQKPLDFLELTTGTKGQPAVRVSCVPCHVYPSPLSLCLLMFLPDPPVHLPLSSPSPFPAFLPYLSSAELASTNPDHKPWVKATWINWSKWTLNLALCFSVILYIATDDRIIDHIYTYCIADLRGNQHSRHYGNGQLTVLMFWIT